MVTKIGTLAEKSLHVALKAHYMQPGDVLEYDLGGYVIADLGGEVVLPAVALSPGAIALVVGEGWTGDGLDDVAPPPDALIVRVERVGRSGIANAHSG